MRKFQKFFNDIAWYASYAKQPLMRDSIKRRLGHSTNNNRTLSVRQAMLDLKQANRYGIANDIQRVYDILKPKIKAKRTRTDAIDLSEFVSTYRTIVMNKRKLRRQIGSILKD